MFTDKQRKKAWSPAARKKAAATRQRNLAVKAKVVQGEIPLAAVPARQPARRRVDLSERVRYARELAAAIVRLLS